MRKQKQHGAPHAPTDTRWGKKALALFLSVAMFLPMLPTVALADNRDAATTDEYGFDLSTPSDFNAKDGQHPFGSSRGIKGNLNPTKEISIMESSGNYYSSRVYDFDESSILKGSSGGVFSSSDHHACLVGDSDHYGQLVCHRQDAGHCRRHGWHAHGDCHPQGHGRLRCNQFESWYT